MLKDKMKTLRKKLGITQQQLADYLGVSRSYVGDLETGRLKGTNSQIISKLARLSGESMEYFLEDNVAIKQYEILDNAINMLIDNNLIDEAGNVRDKASEDILLSILKKEILMKIERRNKVK